MIDQGHKGTWERWRCSPVVHGVLLLLSMCLLQSAQAELLNGQAINCRFGPMLETMPWREVTPLTSETPVGSVLWERYVDLNTQYGMLDAAGKPHELVSAGRWSRGTLLVDGVAPTNVRGIGFKMVVRSSDGQSRPLTQAFEGPVALEKSNIKYSPEVSLKSTSVTHYTQSLVLMVPVSELPGGKLEISRVGGTAQLQLYAVDLPKGAAALGQPITIPSDSFPPGICRELQTFGGAELIGKTLTISSSCVVMTKNVVRQLGRFSSADFPTLYSTSPPSQEVTLQLSQCTALARPRVSFTDLSPRRCEAGILGLMKQGGQVASGLGIVMFNDRIKRIECDTSYEVERTPGSNNATFDFRAQYIRIGRVTPGAANGAVTFEFTFP